MRRDYIVTFEYCQLVIQMGEAFIKWRRGAQAGEKLNGSARLLDKVKKA